MCEDNLITIFTTILDYLEKIGIMFLLEKLTTG